MDSCPFSLDSLEESELGKTLQEGEHIPGRARLHLNFCTAILLWRDAFLFLLFASPKRTPKKVFCIAALISLEAKVPSPHLTSTCSEWEQNAEPKKASVSVGQCCAGWRQAVPMSLLLFSEFCYLRAANPFPLHLQWKRMGVRKKKKAFYCTWILL